MSNMAWSEQELANAAKRVAESMLTSFPSPSECEHVFSDDFEHSMEILRKKSKRRVVAHCYCVAGNCRSVCICDDMSRLYSSGHAAYYRILFGHSLFGEAILYSPLAACNYLVCY